MSANGHSEPMAGLAITLPPELVQTIAAQVTEQLDDRRRAEHEWLTAEEAADHIRAPSRQRIYDLVHAGKLRPGRDGSSLRFRRSDLDAYLLDQGEG